MENAALLADDPANGDEETDRMDEIAAFLADAGWGAAPCVPLAADASFRRYFRLVRPDGARAVLMDAPPPLEDVRPFMHLSAHLTTLGLSVPRVSASDTDAGFLLLDDLGDDTFRVLLNAGRDPEALFGLAVDALAYLHGLPPERSIPADLPAYDTAALTREAMLFAEWYLPAVGMPPSPGALADFRDIWAKLSDAANDVPQTLVLRDVHVDNLMLKAGETGLRQCAFLDFQDALGGPVTYDIMSLLEDRYDLPAVVKQRLRQRYLTGTQRSLDPETFETSYAILTAQRHIKVIGVFTRLDRRDSKPAYLQDIPRRWRLLDAALGHPILSELADWIATNAPAPDARAVSPHDTAAP